MSLPEPHLAGLSIDALNDAELHTCNELQASGDYMEAKERCLHNAVQKLDAAQVLVTELEQAQVDLRSLARDKLRVWQQLRSQERTLSNAYDRAATDEKARLGGDLRRLQNVVEDARRERNASSRDSEQAAGPIKDAEQRLEDAHDAHDIAQIDFQEAKAEHDAVTARLYAILMEKDLHYEREAQRVEEEGLSRTVTTTRSAPTPQFRDDPVFGQYPNNDGAPTCQSLATTGVCHDHPHCPASHSICRFNWTKQCRYGLRCRNVHFIPTAAQVWLAERPTARNRFQRYFNQHWSRDTNPTIAFELRQSRNSDSDDDDDDDDGSSTGNLLKKEQIVPILPKTTLMRVDAARLQGQQCSICLANYEFGESVTTLPCFHQLHTECSDDWFRDHEDPIRCPVCRIVLRTLFASGHK